MVLIDFPHKAYEVYKTEWIESHVSEKLYQETQEEWKELAAEYGDECSFEEYLSEQGFGGMLYACFDEFCDCELKEDEAYYRNAVKPS